MKKKVGLFFGSFNPVHTGHLVIASYIAQYTDLKEVWLVVSPHNPLKEKSSLLADHHRLQMVKIAIEDSPLLKASDIEFKLPQPSYTINTLTHLGEKYPKTEFSLIMGADNLASLTKWKNYEKILEGFRIYVYPRPWHSENPFQGHPGIRITDAPMMELSSSFIRKAIAEKKDVRYMVPDKVLSYIDEMNFYRSKK